MTMPRPAPCRSHLGQPDTTSVGVASRHDERGIGLLTFRPAGFTWARVSRGGVMHGRCGCLVHSATTIDAQPIWPAARAPVA